MRLPLQLLEVSLGQLPESRAPTETLIQGLQLFGHALEPTAAIGVESSHDPSLLDLTRPATPLLFACAQHSALDPTQHRLAIKVTRHHLERRERPLEPFVPTNPIRIARIFELQPSLLKRSLERPAHLARGMNQDGDSLEFLGRVLGRVLTKALGDRFGRVVKRVPPLPAHRCRSSCLRSQERRPPANHLRRRSKRRPELFFERLHHSCAQPIEARGPLQGS